MEIFTLRTSLKSIVHPFISAWPIHTHTHNFIHQRTMKYSQNAYIPLRRTKPAAPEGKLIYLYTARHVYIYYTRRLITMPHSA